MLGMAWVGDHVVHKVTTLSAAPSLGFSFFDGQGDSGRPTASLVIPHEGGMSGLA